MRIGIIGKGRVGTALGSGWTRAGHEVQLTRRDTAPTAQELVAWADVVVLAVPFAALDELAGSIAPATDKILVDCTNPIARDADGIGLALGHTTSGAERLQSILPKARVVKSLNQVGAEIMADTTGFAHPPAQFVAGDDTAAKHTVITLLSDLGFEPIDAGPLSRARLLEPLALIWITQAMTGDKGRDWAFAALPRAC